MNGRIPFRASYAGLLLSVLGGLILLLPSGSAGSAAASGCMAKRCLYDIELAAETRLPKIGTFGLTANFRRITIVHTQTSRSLSIGLGSNHRNFVMTGTVIGALDINSAFETCVHKRTYPATARATFSASIRPGARRAPAGLALDLAPPRVIPPQWAPTCARWQELNRDLASLMGAVGNKLVLLKSPGATGHLAVGHEPLGVPGAASLAATYGYNSQRPQASETSLTSPWRELWAGRSAVIRQRAVFNTPAGDAVTNVRLSLTRR